MVNEHKKINLEKRVKINNKFVCDKKRLNKCIINVD